MKKRILLRVVSLLAVVTLCLSASACGARRSKYGEAFRFPLSAEPRQLDPQVAADAASVEVLHAVMEGLTRLSEEGEVLPGVATSWTLSDKNTTATFTLRDSAWSDGTPLTAEDFVFAWERGASKETRSPFADRFANIKTVVATDPHTLTVTLKTADEAFARTVADSAFYPCQQAFFEKSGGHYGMEQEYVLGNGPFVLSSWSHGEYLILRKNSHYYAKEEILPDQVRYVVNTGETDTLALLRTGGLDAAELTAAEAEELRDGKTAVTTVYDGLFALWMNTACDDLKKPSVRRALCHAVDTEKNAALCEKAGERAAVGFVPPDTRLNGAAYVKEADSLGAFAEGKRPSREMAQLTLLCGEDALSLDLAREILQAWQKQFSLYFKLESLPAEELASRVEDGDYDLALYAAVSVGGEVPQVLSAYKTGAAGNVAELSDKTFDSLLEKATDETSLRKAEAQLYTACPCLPLYYPARTFAFGKGVEGVTVHPFGGGAFGAVYEFRTATKND